MTSSLHPRSTNALLAAIFSLFTSSATLLCCALPALFVAVGAGAVLAGIVSALPGLIWLSAHKLAVFATAGLMLVAAGVLTLQGRRAPCPTDPRLKQACIRVRKTGTVIYTGSLVLYAVGALFAFVLPLASN